MQDLRFLSQNKVIDGEQQSYHQLLKQKEPANLRSLNKDELMSFPMSVLILWSHEKQVLIHHQQRLKVLPKTVSNLVEALKFLPFVAHKFERWYKHDHRLRQFLNALHNIYPLRGDQLKLLSQNAAILP